MFAKKPILTTFDHTKKIRLETDSSDYAIGAMLSQPNEQGRWILVYYYSWKHSPAELNYKIHNKELLAIVIAMREWDVYLQRATHKIEVLLDHENLTKFMTTKVLNR